MYGKGRSTGLCRGAVPGAGVSGGRNGDASGTCPLPDGPKETGGSLP
jgi:hypothetical protein